MTRKSRLAVGVSAVALSIALAMPAMAQPLLEEIVVTARKREESLKEIPLSITAFSARDIERKGFKGLEDIAFAAPGVQYSNQAGQIPGRYNSAIRFRGMNVNSETPSLQLGSLFIDGIYVLGGTQSIPLSDLERIEVIKGPQSAYFGRNTFGGAINYITKTPSTSEYKGKISASGATYEEFDVSADHEGPLVEGKLAYRIGTRLYSRGAMFTASDGGDLGAESSKAVNGTIYATPTDNFTAKLRVFYNKDDDSAPAGGQIQGIRNDSCTGKTVTTQDPVTPIARPQQYICGQVPKQGQAISSLGNLKIIDSNTSLFPGQAALIGRPTYLVDNLVTRANPPQVNVPFIDHMGLERDIFRFSASFDYEFASGYSAALQGGYNKLRANWIRDFGLSAIENWYSRDPQDASDKSIEFRITSPQDQRLTWLAGANYYKQSFIQSGSGGDAISLCTAIAAQPLPGERCPRIPFFTANSLLQNTDKIKAWGIFGSAEYDITDELTFTFEGRYQHNDAATAVLTPAPLKKIDKNFLPRAILRWQPTDETNVYASYAKGVIQGQPNAQVATATPNELRQYVAQLPSAGPTLPAEILDMYEVGWKQTFMENRANLNLAGYYGEWKGQKGRGLVVLQEDCGSPSHGFSGGCTTGTPVGLGLPGQPARNLDGTPFLNSRNVNAPGTSKIWGVELESAIAVTEAWTVNGNLTYARSKYKDFLFNFFAFNTGYSQMKGNSNPRFPKWTGTLNSGYTGDLNQDWDWYVNGDLIYFGKTMVDESNLAFCNDYWLVNSRAGVEKEGFRVELFVKNLFNDDNWAACNRWTDFDNSVNLAFLTRVQGIAVTPQNKRQFGLRTSVDF
ncbi:MAG: TonB-dependent receptor [Rhodospirillaceae bacterium]|nr:TonB-dependent receptor [Rhodospirillaceae bacterium]